MSSATELDVYWPEYRFAVELDVFETHGSRESFEADRLRQEELKLAGVELVRITGRRFEREPGRIVERVGHLLEARAASLQPSIPPRGPASRSRRQGGAAR
jgi:very-short-patch-repair endonuclease